MVLRWTDGSGLSVWTPYNCKGLYKSKSGGQGEGNVMLLALRMKEADKSQKPLEARKGKELFPETCKENPVLCVYYRLLTSRAVRSLSYYYHCVVLSR